VLAVAGDVLRVEPLLHESAVTARCVGDRAGVRRAEVGEGAVQPELVADDHRRRVQGDAEVAGELVDELLEMRFVDRHRGPSWSGGAPTERRVHLERRDIACRDATRQVIQVTGSAGR
jgi:hypothetical protein